VGGGLLKIVNQTVPMALARLGYEPDRIAEIVRYIDEQETIEGAPHLRAEHLAVFDCAFRPANGKRSIHWMGHVRMMGAVQPFLSGAISKTVNLPEDATIEDITTAYTEAWRLGLKALAVYRDGCKRSQPLNTGKAREDAGREALGQAVAKVISIEEARPRRVKLPDERVARTHKFSIAGHEGYLTVGLYEDGDPGEIFLRMAKEGSTVSGLMDTIATMTSIALQYGVPLKALVDKFSHTRFEPSGFTNNPEIPFAKSVTDYVFRYLGSRFLQSEAPPDEQEADGLEAPVRALPRAAVAGGSGRTPLTASGPATGQAFVNQSDAPACTDCGSITVRNGACYKCANCGLSMGCS
jgi:ribonucleoside-diphosphate reductase alpha chain